MGLQGGDQDTSTKQVGGAPTQAQAGVSGVSMVGESSQSLPILMSLEHHWTASPQGWIFDSSSCLDDYCNVIGSNSCLHLILSKIFHRIGGFKQC